MFKKIYLGFGVVVILLYGSAAMFGWEISRGERQQLPPDARQNGYRSFHFWPFGFRGGK